MLHKDPFELSYRNADKHQEWITNSPQEYTKYMRTTAAAVAQSMAVHVSDEEEYDMIQGKYKQGQLHCLIAKANSPEGRKKAFYISFDEAPQYKEWKRHFHSLGLKTIGKHPLNAD